MHWFRVKSSSRLDAIWYENAINDRIQKNFQMFIIFLSIN